MTYSFPRLLSILPCCILLSGCGQANAVIVDPANDVHCSVVAFYFHGFAKHDGAPKTQQDALRTLHHWYAIKMKIVAGERFKEWANVEREVGPVLEAIKADPRSMRDELGACTDRAAADPLFDGFMRELRK